MWWPFFSRRKLLQAGLASVAGAATTGLGQQQGEKKPLDRTIAVATDDASFYLYHPDDLAHRLKSPAGWQWFAFACRPEFEAGRLAIFSTGGDGAHQLRVTTGPLTEREQRMLVGAWEFRLRVRRGRVFLDADYRLPHDRLRERPLADDDRRWIDLPNGDYRVEVNTINFYDEPEIRLPNGGLKPDALSSYVIRFQPIDNIDAVSVRSSTAPRMVSELAPRAGDDCLDRETFEEEKGPLQGDAYILWETPEWRIVPSYDGTLPVSRALYMAAYDFQAERLVDRFVLAPPRAEAGGWAILVEKRSGRSSNNETFRITFESRRLVRIKEKFEQEGWTMVHVESLERKLGPVPDDVLTSLKTIFAEYAARSEAYRNEVPCAAFEVERVAAMKSTEGITNVLIHHLRIDDRRRIELLQLSTAERVPALIKIMNEEVAK